MKEKLLRLQRRKLNRRIRFLWIQFVSQLPGPKQCLAQLGWWLPHSWHGWQQHRHHAVCSGLLSSFSCLSLCQYQHPDQLDQYSGRGRLCVLKMTVRWARSWGIWVQASILPLALKALLSLSTKPESHTRDLCLLFPIRRVYFLIWFFPGKEIWDWISALRKGFVTDSRSYLGLTEVACWSIKWGL